MSIRNLALEALHRGHARFVRLRERQMLDRLNDRPLHLSAGFRGLSATEMAAHFSSRTSPSFFSGFEELRQSGDHRLRELTSDQQLVVIEAEQIRDHHRWALLGYPPTEYGKSIDWLSDPISRKRWPSNYHHDLMIVQESRSDIRMLWEINRLSHLLKLAEGYLLTGDESFSEEFFSQIDSWKTMNPVGRGPNWMCAMEVAIRAMNILAAFEAFRHSRLLDQSRLETMLSLFDSHGRHIRRNLEFSYLGTSNHYLSDVAGLFWLGLLVPELDAAIEWREFGLREILSELDKQVLTDGAHFESSTGYHRLALEFFLYSFFLCRQNGIKIEARYWVKLRLMADFMRSYMRPDGLAPIIGDSDSGRVLPLISHSGNDHAYMLGLAAVVLNDGRYRIEKRAPAEIRLLFGKKGLSTYQGLTPATLQSSRCFKDAGVCVLRKDDLYLHMNASGAGMNGRGSHGHNDALSVEVSACGTAFIVDPGTFVYTKDLDERHRFRSTAYHSTVEVDDTEQNTISRETPFVAGNEARPRIVKWETSDDIDIAAAEHYGYSRLAEPVIHHREVRFDKRKRYWIIKDEFRGRGQHRFKVRFHFAPGLDIRILENETVEARDPGKDTRLLVVPTGISGSLELEELFSSQDYGSKEPSTAACWEFNQEAPFSTRWILVPVSTSESISERLVLISEIASRQMTD